MEVLQEYFDGRHWCDMSLEAAVGLGQEIEEARGEVFTWLTSTNSGAAEVCRAALLRRGISDEQLEAGYLVDPASKSDLGMLAIPGIKVRLTRNLDKTRGFVNGATGTICESLRGNAVFTVRLHGTGNLVLVYPIEEGGALFVPCCYGYATTIRRAQGASLGLGCVWFNQRWRAAGLMLY